MRRSVLRNVFVVVCVSLSMVFSSCALLDTSTQTSDGDAKFDLGEYHGLKHAVGCLDFQNQAGWRGQFEIGNNLSILLESALFDTGRFVIVEREKLGAVMREQDLQASGRMAKASKVAKTGVLRPAKYIATGAVTQVDEGTSGGNGGVSFGGFSIGGGKSKAQITIIAKLVDTTTGEIVQKKRIVGKAGRVGMNVGLHVGKFGTKLGGFKKTPLGEAAQDCINQAAYFFATSMEAMPFEGSVVKVSAGRVIINRGSEFGITMGKELVMREQGETLTDPSTGAVLGMEEGKEIGKLKVTSVREKLSYCEVVSGEKNPATGTVLAEN